jgi:hypothetical protein
VNPVRNYAERRAPRDHPLSIVANAGPVGLAHRANALAGGVNRQHPAATRPVGPEYLCASNEEALENDGSASERGTLDDLIHPCPWPVSPRHVVVLVFSTTRLPAPDCRQRCCSPMYYGQQQPGRTTWLASY